MAKDGSEVLRPRSVELACRLPFSHGPRDAGLFCLVVLYVFGALHWPVPANARNRQHARIPLG